MDRLTTVRGEGRGRDWMKDEGTSQRTLMYNTNTDNSAVTARGKEAQGMNRDRQGGQDVIVNNKNLKNKNLILEGRK